MANQKMYYMEELEKVLECAFLTAWLEKENPVSLLLVGPSGVGKSMLLCKYTSKSFLRTDSITSKGLYDIAIADKENRTRFLLIPDMNPTLSRKPTTVEATISNLLSFTSDGTVRVDDGREAKTCEHHPIGIISAVTSEIYSKNARKWFILGLRRRIIPLFYNYKDSTIRKLQELVANDKIRSALPTGTEWHENGDKTENRLDSHPFVPEILTEKIIAASIILSGYLGKNSFYDLQRKKHRWDLNKIVPISPQITLQNLARAHAMTRNKGIVDQEDVNFLYTFLEFCDPENPKQL